MSSCATVAARSTAMHSIFQTPKFNSAGLFAMNVYVRGRPYTLVIDDYLPFLNNKLTFDHLGADKSTWGPYLEKAWAHVSGNYEMTDGGLHTEALEFLTGCPANLWNIQNDLGGDATQVWNKLTDATANNYLIGISCPSENDGVNGIIGGHAYSVLGTYVVTDGTTFT